MTTILTNKRYVKRLDGSLRALAPGEHYVLSDGETLVVPLLLQDGTIREQPVTDDDDPRAKPDRAHAEMVRSITMAHRHPTDRETPPEDREQVYAKMREDISNAWMKQPP
jgi:hypothetical protein